VPDGRRFLIELVDRPGTSRVPVYRRLAVLLKRLGRTYGFRCTSAVEIRAEPPEPAVGDTHDQGG
jgi:hypothetical protein